MISFVCCSIKLAEAERVRLNIESTIGVPFEFICFDNREHSFGLCKVYNMCAEKAKYDYICFVHEDVKYNTQDWGTLIINKLSEKDCGVIGFAGSTVKINYPTGWIVERRCTRMSMIQHYKRKKRFSVKSIAPKSESYSQVIPLDGFCLFVRKDVWSECRFDEVYFTGFHAYDVDFSMTVAQKYKNYVCNIISIEHFSDGSFSQQWYDETLRLHEKWESKLPMSVPGADLDPCAMKAYFQSAKYMNIKAAMKARIFPIVGFSDVMKHILKYPFAVKSWRLIEKYVKYRLQYKTGNRK